LHASISKQIVHFSKPLNGAFGKHFHLNPNNLTTTS